MAQAGLRELPATYVLDSNGSVVLRVLEDKKLPFVPVPLNAIRAAEAGQVPLLTPAGTFQVAAIAKLQKYPDRYLYVARELSPKVMGHLQRTEQSVDEFNRLRRARGGLKLAHGLIYTMISMTGLLAAIWCGLWFASRFVAPIRRLIAAAQEVSRGNLKVALPERRGEGDLRRLSTTFNTMTREIKHQRDALVTANEQLLDRRRFMEAVLSGVSAGIIGLDSQDRVTLLSRAAEQLLQMSEADVAGKKIADVLPMFGPALEKREEPHHKSRGSQEIAVTIGGEERVFAVRVTREQAGPGDVGSVVTFDDVTELVSAQRTSAWADVARRIAHEIKNPLTPIILSAERIRRKYGKVITEDRETFDKLTETIERQAGDIKTMVDEFASFARIPKPVMEMSDLRDAVLDFGDPVPRKPRERVVRSRAAARAGARVVRSPPSDASGDEPGQECYRGRRDLERGRRARTEGTRRGQGPPREQHAGHRHHRQRPRTSEAQSRPPARTLCHHQGTQGNGARTRDRAENHRAARRRASSRRRPSRSRTDNRRARHDKPAAVDPCSRAAGECRTHIQTEPPMPAARLIDDVTLRSMRWQQIS